MAQLDSPSRELYYGKNARRPPGDDDTETVVEFLFELSRPGPMREELHRRVTLEENGDVQRGDIEGEDKVIEMEKRIERAYRTYKDSFPLSIWDCCKKGCFSMLAADHEQFSIFDEALRIHELAQALHRRVGEVGQMVQTRGRGVGVSHIDYVGRSRRERDPLSTTDRCAALRQLGEFIADVLPFLYGMNDSRNGVRKPKNKLCTTAICGLLGVSRNLLYKRKRTSLGKRARDDELFASVLDTAGVRMRQHRRLGKRTGYPEIEELNTFECGCPQPCFANAPIQRLYEWYESFKELSKKLRPRRRENQYLLNIMMCPLLSTTVNICNNSLSALFTVSVAVIADVRRVLNAICGDPNLESRKFLDQKAKGYNYTPRHPINRYPCVVREHVETYLDMILRADPGASDGVNVCRVYSPEINTQEKLRKVLAKNLTDDDVVDHPLSASTLKRMVDEYLESKKCTISFTQSDHNACPICKCLQYAILQFHHEKKILESRRKSLEGDPSALSDAVQLELDSLAVKIEAKGFQESESLQVLSRHTVRDARIRQFLKLLTDHFRGVERQYATMHEAPCGWRQRHDHAILTHQDDMTKVDLPSFIITASSDITRWRYDVNAHVSAVTGECVVFSHEQGTGAKTGSSIIELILLDHILRCQGEGIKFIVSDNAAVGKNWLTTIALPQYMVDQGLADVVVIVYLENNHGKWLADMMFGQLQIRRRRSTIIGIDALLSEFESINRNDGGIQGFAVNPLSSVDFGEVFSSLGYETKPPKDFCFVKRNIHFASACASGARERLPVELQKLMGEMLPEEEGVVRICSDPPSGCRQEELHFESRYFDVPATCLKASSLQHDARALASDFSEAPLIIPVEKCYAPSGPGVVNYRNMIHVGYNGFEFRNLKAYPELHHRDDPLVKEAWPPGLLDPTVGAGGAEPVSGTESRKCAPENWVLRRPVSRFATDGNIVARYPPRNMLNAKFKCSPRERGSLVPVQTYEEPPFPLKFESKGRTSAFLALSNLNGECTDLYKSPSVLDVLRCIYRSMGDREGMADPWLQRRASHLSAATIAKYREGVKLFNERERGHPRAPKTLRQLFKEDPSIREKVTRDRNDPSGETQETAAKVVVRLFDEAMITPGALERFEHQVEKDVERYAKELKHFKEVSQRKFDEEHGLLPLQSQDTEG